MLSHALILLVALLLDAALGEPDRLWRRWPHPAVLMGRAVGWLDERLNHPPMRRAKGLVAVLVLVAGAMVLGAVIHAVPDFSVLEIALLAILLAHRSLVDHVEQVADALAHSLDEARLAVAKIVGRDTRDMDEAAISRAAIESAAENFSDGVVAPAFWYLLLGLPGVLACKVVNTADSMIGYRSEKYAAFGWAAARLDDLMNWIPARLSAILILLAHGKLRALPLVRRDARLHRSPNAGWPEAAMAIVLGVSLAGPRSYDGEMRDFPFVHPEGRAPGRADIRAAARALWRAWVLLVAATGGMGLVGMFF